MNKLRYQLLNELLEHRDTYLSGEELSNRLKVTRTSVWKHMEELRKDGYEITAAKKRGYKLTGVPDSLSESTILPYLESKSFGQQLYVHDVVDSTMDIAQDLALNEAPEGTLVIANHQRLAKGRMGRKWFSPPGTGIWMSMILRPDIPFADAPQLTLLTSVAVLQGIQQIADVNIGIKWPNDLLINNKKVVGILTQLNAEPDQIHDIIIGVGINVNQLEQDFPEEIREKVTSLRMEQAALEYNLKEIDVENAALIDQPLPVEAEEESSLPKLERNKLIIHIVKEWEKLYHIYLQCGFAPIKTLWESYSVSLGKTIVARTINGNYEGVAKEINDDGVLLLEDNKGEIHKIYSADIEIIS